MGGLNGREVIGTSGRDLRVLYAFETVIDRQSSDRLSQALERAVYCRPFLRRPLASQERKPKLQCAQLAHRESHRSQEVRRECTHFPVVPLEAQAGDESARFVEAFAEGDHVIQQCLAGDAQPFRNVIDGVGLAVRDLRNEEEDSIERVRGGVAHASTRESACESARLRS